VAIAVWAFVFLIGSFHGIVQFTEVVFVPEKLQLQRPVLGKESDYQLVC
jgi:hypothetical protein